MTGISPADTDAAEVHDATSFCETYQVEMMGFCARDEGGAWVESGATTLAGRIAVKLSGGLVAKRHPVDATGLSMTAELVMQLRGTRQVRAKLKARAGRWRKTAAACWVLTKRRARCWSSSASDHALSR